MIAPAWAFAAGSDAPTPYTVDAAGITLPAGDEFVDGGHVNVRLLDGTSRGIHFEALNGQPSGRWIGESFLPWSAFDLDPAAVCVAWVQPSQHNEHYGEGGQPPVGAGCRAPVTPSPEPTVTASPTPPPSQTPTPSASPSPSPEVTVAESTHTAPPEPQPGEHAEGVGPTRLAATGDNPPHLLTLTGLAGLAAGAVLVASRKGARR